MTYVLIALLLAYVIWLYLNSKSGFFYQTTKALLQKKQHLQTVMLDFGIDHEEAKRWFQAYWYFMEHPYKYDGATIVKNLHTIKGYDAPAGNHDYGYIHTKWFTWKGFINSYKLDYQYGKDMRTLQIPYTIAWGRVLCLWVCKPFWYLIVIFK